MPQEKVFGVIDHESGERRTDFLYRVSLKCLVRSHDKILVVKEAGRTWWDLPGGGMDHGESVKATIAREMGEEVGLEGDFSYRILAVEEPKLVRGRSFWQIRLIFEVNPKTMHFTAGKDGDDVAYMDPVIFKDSTILAEQKIYDYSRLA